MVLTIFNMGLVLVGTVNNVAKQVKKLFFSLFPQLDAFCTSVLGPLFFLSVPTGR